MGKNKKRIVIAVCLFVFVFFASFITLTILINQPSVQKKIIKKISEKTGYNIKISSIKVSISHGLGIKISNIYFEPKDSSFLFSCPKTLIYYSLKKLIKGKFIPDSVILDNPYVFYKKLVSSKKKVELKPEKIFLIAASFSSFSIRNGNFSFKPFDISVNKIFFKTKRKTQNKIYLSINSDISMKAYRFPLYVHGDIYMDNGAIKASLDTELSRFPLTFIHKKDVISFINGIADAKMRINLSSRGRIKSSGKLSIKDLNFVLTGSDNQKKKYKFSSMDIYLDTDYLNKIITFHKIRLSADDFELDASSKVNLNSASPYISLKVKSESMSMIAFKKIFPSCFLPDWLEKRLFPIIKGGKLRKIRFCINGTAEQIGNIDKEKNKSVFYGSLIMDNLSFYPKGARYPLRHIKGEVLLKDGDFLLKDISADFASSVIKNAILTIKDVYQDSRSYYVHVNGSFRLENLVAQKDMEFTPASIINSLKGIKKVSGLMEADVRCEYKDSYDMPIFNNSSVKLSNCYFIHKNIHFPVYIKKGKFWVDSTGRYNFTADGRFGKSQLYVLFSSDSMIKHFKLNISGNAYLAELLKPYVEKVRIKGPAQLSVHINKNDIWDIKGRIHLTKKLSLQIASFSLYPKLSTLDFAILYSNGKLRIKRALFRSHASSFSGSGTYIIPKKRLKLRFKTNGLMLEDLGAVYQHFTIAKGKLIAYLKIDIPFDKIFDTTIYGPLEIRALNIKKKREYVLKKCNLKAKFSGKKISISSLDAEIANHPFHLRANIAGWNGISGRIYAKIDHIDLSKLRIRIKGKKKKTGNNFLKKSKLDISLLISDARCKRIIFSPIKTRLNIIKGDIYIKELLASLPSGKLKIQGHIKSKNPDIWFDSDIRLKKMPLEDIFSCMGVKKYIDGKINIKAHIYTRAPDINQIISHLNGNVKVSIKDGKIYKAQPVLKLLDFFSLSNIWKFDPKSLFADGVPFEKIYIKAGIKNGIITSDKMFMESNALNAAAKGELDLSKKTINMGIGIHPLNTVDSIIGNLPIVGYILGGKDKKITLYYFEIKGPLKDVKIEQKPFKNLVKGTLGIFKRILLTPSHVFEDLGG